VEGGKLIEESLGLLPDGTASKEVIMVVVVAYKRRV
jgi:hypothetical protein